LIQSYTKRLKIILAEFEHSSLQASLESTYNSDQETSS